MPVDGPLQRHHLHNITLLYVGLRKGGRLLAVFGAVISFWPQRIRYRNITIYRFFWFESKFYAGLLIALVYTRELE